MHLQYSNQKTEQSSKVKKQYCKGKTSGNVTIPASWGLNDMQRNFIEMMSDKSSNS